MEKVQKISTAQFFSLLLLSRLLSTLTFMPVFNVNVNNSDYIVAIFLGSAAMLLLLLPMYLLFKKGDGRGVMERSEEVSPTLSRSLCVLYVIFFLIDAYSTLLRLNLFVASAVFPDTDTRLFLLLTVAAVCYSATKGIEALGRAGSVSLAILLASFVFVLLTMLSRVDINNLSPVFYDGAKPVMTVAWSVVIRTTEPVAISVMLPKVTGNLKKSVVLWTAFFALFVSALFFILFTTSGNSALLNMFPVHSMAVLSEFGLIERLDVLLTGVWIISAFVKITFIIYIINDILSRSFAIKNKNAVVYSSGTVIFAAVMLFSGNIDNFRYTSNTVVKTVLFVLFAVLIPAFVMILEKVKRRKFS